jgi:predicted membrane-bound mannosyltransferase
VEQALEKPLSSLIKLDWEKALYITIIVLALVTRLWGLGDRVQSHDESIHTKYSWNLYVGQGFQHSPLMHGPFLFHATALSYFLFGDNDFTARVPVALMGVLVVAFPYLLRRWLGRPGALATSFFLLISPAIAYYSRYIRHDIPVILWSLVAVFAILSYLREGRERWLYLMAAGVSLMFASKEVAFIYNAIFGLFLVGLFLVRVTGQEWLVGDVKPFFVIALAVAVVGLAILGLGVSTASVPAEPVATPESEVVEERLIVAWWAVAGGILAGVALLAAIVLLLIGHLRLEDLTPPPPVIALVVVAIVVGVLLRLGLPMLLSYSSCALEVPGPLLEGLTAIEKRAASQQYRAELWACTRETFREFDWPEGRCILVGRLFPDGILIDVRRVLTVLPFASGVLTWLAWLAARAFCQYRVFDLIVVLGTFCLPLLSAFVIRGTGLDAIDYNTPTIYYSGAIALEVWLLSIAIGLVWDVRRYAEGEKSFSWLISAAIYYAIFVVLFTTVFTNGAGIASGMVGSLGYWLKQQGVERGSQPGHYYIVMVLLYEYLPLLLALIAPVYLAIRELLLPFSRVDSEDDPRTEARQSPVSGPRLLFVVFALWWAVMAWVGYSAAGERMPWLTVHLALPMILLSGWLIGRLIEGTDWRRVLWNRAWLVALVAPPFAMAFAAFVRAASSGPFRGNGLAQLTVTGQFLGGLLGVLAFGAALGYWIWRSGWRVALRVLLLVALLLPVFLTLRTAWRFCYVNYDYPVEHLVYAHAAPAVGETMRQIEEISRRTLGDPQLIKVAYGSDGSTLWYWQLRNFPNAAFYGESPSREQMDAPIVIAGREQWDAVAPYLGDDYLVNTYTYLWWPMEDYRDLSWARTAITSTQTRAALWDMWYDRDYRRYDELTGKTHTLDKWPLRSEYRLYIRRDVAAQMWELSTSEPIEIVTPTDRYVEGWKELSARVVFGSVGSVPGQFQSPRGIEIGPDGYVYVADSGNHRIQKFTFDGEFVAAWGVRSDRAEEGAAPRGFLEPWDVAVAPNGEIYVADTWNHRIQRLDGEGNLLGFWGLFGEFGPLDGEVGESAFYGPRGVVIGPDGRVYVADTGTGGVPGRAGGHCVRAGWRDLRGRHVEPARAGF